MIALGFLMGVLFMMGLRTIVYRTNKFIIRKGIESLEQDINGK